MHRADFTRFKPMSFYIVSSCVFVISVVSVIAAEPASLAFSDSMTDVVILPTMLFVYRKLLAMENRLKRQHRMIQRLTAWRREVHSQADAEVTSAAAPSRS
jgi:hypothetical protein